ncbi:MAG: CDP-diacylglycerol--glycerol-3-phosphate 3-phosphatidyltransferase [Syntrophales bacterium]|nr:CDP-diacylglycerol--glycerol-3-phosphate 3-phosphatidyltransferase [Syntrophales bacterium]MDD5533396.1 CDP-diacylglycerol--glycerol-3-phosphate 3-phosphatidyltransferase [Syntrophales bacterium]
MNIPNTLTVLRIILVPIMVICLIQAYYVEAFVIFIFASITDGLDGFLARVLKQKSVLGAYLDPLADKALIASAFVTLSIMGIIPAWLTVIVISRDFVILVGICVLTFLSVSFEIRPAPISKITTALQFATIFFAMLAVSKLLVFEPLFLDIIFWLTAGLTVLSGLNYIIKGVQHINSST